MIFSTTFVRNIHGGPKVGIQYIVHSVDFFGLLTNVIMTLISFSSVIDFLGRPDFGALATEPVASNLSLMR